VPAALVEAVLMPDSLPYRALADSAGNFAMPLMPPGDYLVWGVVDQNGNRRRDPREAFDTVRVTLQDSASLELYAFAHDTVGPRLRAVDALDSLTLRLSFDRPLDPTQAPDTAQVHVATAADSTAFLALAAVLTPAGWDSVTKAAAAAAAAADSAKRAAEAARDTTRRPAAAPPARAPAAAAPARARPGGPPLARPDTTRAMRMLLRRPAPTDNRVVRLVAPLEPGARYVIMTEGLRGLTGLARPGRAALLAPKPAPRRTAADSLRAGAGAGRGPRGAGPDSLRPPTGPDSTPPAPRPPSDTLPARPDSGRPASRPPAR